MNNSRHHAQERDIQERDTQERGAVLLTTLLLMSVMAVITLAIMDDIRFSIIRTGNVQAVEQLDWHYRGGELFAQDWLDGMTVDNQKQFDQLMISDQPVTLPFEEGEMLIKAHDGRNCFNVNQLARQKSPARVRGNFARLLTLLEFDPFQAESIAAAVQDWVDADNIPVQGGAEGLVYGNRKPAHSAANTLMIDISELRAVEGIDEEAYQRLKPFVCARRNTRFNRINLNTLRVEEAPLLALVLRGDESLSRAQKIIADRPQDGFNSVDEVWERKEIRELDLKGAGKNRVNVETDLVELDISLRYGEQVRTGRVVYRLKNGEGAQLVSRRPLD